MTEVTSDGKLLNERGCEWTPLYCALCYSGKLVSLLYEEITWTKYQCHNVSS